MADLKTKTRYQLPLRALAKPEKRAYPIRDRTPARNAKARVGETVSASRMSKAEEAKKADLVLNPR